MDFIVSIQRSIVTRTPESVLGNTVGLESDGWLMPKLGVAFIWITTDGLDSESDKPSVG